MHRGSSVAFTISACMMGYLDVRPDKTWICRLPTVLYILCMNPLCIAVMARCEVCSVWLQDDGYDWAGVHI